MNSPDLAVILARYAGRARDALLPLLAEVQAAFGHIGPEAVRAISHALRLPEAEIYGVIEYYAMFHTEPAGETIIRVCADPSCALQGADHILHDLETRLGVEIDATTPDHKFTVLKCTCLGLCEHAPAALVSRRARADTSIAPITYIDRLMNAEVDTPKRAIRAYSDHPVLLAGLSDQPSLAQYGGYKALRRALADMSPEAVMSEVEASALIGRGGAAFPTGTKWKMTRQAAATPHYVVCNADESEPGTFKDRVLMEHNPHLVIEGIALCSYAVGAEKAYIFVRGEYPEAAEVLEQAIADAHTAGLLGKHILGSAFSLDIELRRGAGAYLCGEETALFEAIEGKRGMPRIKPPFPTTHGLFGKPTCINNVETLSTIPGIITQGAAWFRGMGTERSTGTKLVAVSGHVERPGVYEILPGLPLRALLDERCGMQGPLQAVLMGGASGTFLTPKEIDVPLSFEGLRAIGGTFGSGAIMVFNESVDLRDVLRRLGQFFKHESCGKCFPCQLGTQRQMEILNRSELPLPGDRQRLIDIGLTMTEASLCGLGQTAGSAVLSAIKKWPELFYA